MKKKLLRRTIALASTAALCALSVGLFAGCTTDYPEITITYSFQDVDYEVDYKLSREATPRTVQHFIELADAGYYDGTIIHNYQSSFLYGGGYTLDENGELVQKDYYAEVKKIEEEDEDFKFDQSVFLTDYDAPDRAGDPLYTVYGEFSKNGYDYTGPRGFSHTTGALVMYHNYDKDDVNPFSGRVTAQRNKDGEYKDNYEYRYNSATSLFYTFTGENRSDLDEYYCVFGMAMKYDEQMAGDNGLLTAISDYIGGLGEDETFTTELKDLVDLYDHNPEDEAYRELYSEKVRAFFEKAYKSGKERTFNTPVDMPIIVKSVKVNKY